MKHPLDKSLRNDLEKAVKQARTIAEAAVSAALDQLGVGEPTTYDHLSEDDKDLRRRLRTHGRQLGDERKPNAQQETIRLREEIAYEQWHRMLFARFLAENNLLMYDGVSVTLGECSDLAEDADVAHEWQLQGVNGQPSLWELAAKLATAMLPQIFRTDSPAFELLLPPEQEQKLEKILNNLPKEMFTASDSLGWVYQFWQAKRKEEVNASEVKIGARELPAVTQLFTEPYMVSFLLDNALGAWWAGKRLTETDWTTATSETELREKASIDGVPLEYLRFVQDEEGRWAPASGFFEKWPESLAELKMLDPSSGSGHFLVSVLQMLVPLRMEMENLTAKEAIDAVLSQNLHGLELDSRCVELAAFAVALAAWTFPGAKGFRPLPEMNIACSGLAVSVAKDEWKKLAFGKKKNLGIALEWMYDTFKDAPVLGSLINPARSDASKIIEWDELSQMLTEALEQEEGEEQHEVGVVAQGLAKAAMMLADKYHWVVTNVPYLGNGKQCQILQDFCNTEYESAKHDLATVFLERCIEYCQLGGTTSIVLPQNWLFLGRYKKFREKLLIKDQWNLIVRLGAKGFTTPMYDFNVQLITISNGGQVAYSELWGDSQKNFIRGIDVSEYKSADVKANKLVTTEVKSVDQQKQLNNPDHIVIIDEIDSSIKKISDYAVSKRGIVNGDNDKWLRKYWEIFEVCKNWQFLQTAVNQHLHYFGRETVINWKSGGKGMLRPGLGNLTYGNVGIAVSRMAHLPSTIYTGEFYDQNTAVLCPGDPKVIVPFWCYTNDKSFSQDVRKFDQKIGVTPATLLKIPFNLDHWQKVAIEKYPNGLPKPYSNDPTQWIFHGHPCGSVVWDEDSKWTASVPLRIDDTVLQVAVARLLGYQWPAELDSEMELADKQRELVEQCAELLPLADEDGIVCIPSVRGEGAAEDRLLDMLKASYGEKWDNSVLNELLGSVGYNGKKLENWLRDKFFTQHCRMFGNRPFIWHIWDGLIDGFSVLVNYHKFDAKQLETLIYTYLGDWISRQTAEVENGVDGAQVKLDAAKQLKKRLELIAEGEAPYDIFVRWKPLEEQPVGWNPDLNDGVRLNVRPFVTVPDIGKNGAGILRDKFNVKWTKDRGKDVVSAPWYRLGPLYDGKEGDRINEHHLTLEEKRKARDSE
ncbi:MULTISPECIES: N-6 DNA methylase [unclassified Oceanispirochaeta]|uniref:Eco57I restriction-modification methylase domain-containing protein n=1 Tax=unclassified Oceanispirochaeta TaxID=2635722 RepID=UPI000E099950|nr:MULTISPECIES: N-6 DNA methylase [unclassified Oceanispirochaeta]MBF9018801.1 N-6 DNA methylase [Oceanispirochaeta sp. M2]NPD75270.1 N-6 DNA methylase [Oceanispirochaeta sp. M1]RDG28884.1 SAM-dependent DNA methyltransferase [Oceanispirochaeta sp. M1]